MNGENHLMTEWLKLERLERNNLPLPRYETEFSAGVDFAACLTRPCKHVPPGCKHKKAEPFVCLQQDYRQRIFGGDWQNIQQPKTPRLLIMPRETVMIPLGFKSEFGKSFVLHIHVRSSMGLSGLILANGTAIIDPDYRGELFVPVYNRNQTVPIIIDHGQRIVQGVLLQFNQAVVVETIVDITQRGDGGFGSTDVDKAEGPPPQ